MWYNFYNMKIVFLNTWGGQAGDCLIDFFKEKKDEVDFFALQEVFDGGYNQEVEIVENVANKRYSMLTDLKSVLRGYRTYFRPNLGDWYGLASFIKDEYEVLEEKFILVHGELGYIPKDDLGFHSRIIQDCVLRMNGKKVHVINFHGLWNGQGKGDSEDRIEQSGKIIEYLKGLSGEIILGGDFNLLPDTESMQVFESFGLRNLVKEFGITSTRTARYKKDERFADYVLVSSGVKVNDFLVMPDDVSDHSPLMLDFEVG